jgi:hypothetical protein
MKRRIAFVISAVALAAAAIAIVKVVYPGFRPTPHTVLTPEQPEPRVEITEPTQYEYGKMSPRQRYSHTWLVKNVGDADLVLWVEESSGTAYPNLLVGPDSDRPRARVKPNESTRIEVQCRTETPINEYRSGCVIGTNDPERRTFTLIVKGFIDPPANR